MNAKRVLSKKEYGDRMLYFMLILLYSSLAVLVVDYAPRTIVWTVMWILLFLTVVIMVVLLNVCMYRQEEVYI